MVETYIDEILCSAVNFASPFFKIWFGNRNKKAKKDCNQILLRQKTEAMNFFNVTSYSYEMALHDFRVLLANLKFLLMTTPSSWDERRTIRKGYYCDDTTECFFALKILSSTCTWRNIDETFGTRGPIFKDVFWETKELIG